jgi:thioredoxin-like negative regulator of GroEL
MNVDQNRDVPAKFGIRGIPTLMVFKGGQLAATKVGALSKAQLDGLHRPATGLIHRQARWARTEQRGPSFPPFFSCHNPA